MAWRDAGPTRHPRQEWANEERDFERERPTAAAAAAASTSTMNTSAAATPASDLRFAICLILIILISWARLLSDRDGREKAQWHDHAVTAGYAALSMLLAFTTRTAAYRQPRVRHTLVALFRILSFLGADHLAHENIMSKPPTASRAGPLVDLTALLLGSEAVKLFFVSAFLPLPLPAHLAVSTLSLVFPMRLNKGICNLALLNNPVATSRIAAFHTVMAAGSGGALPPGPPLHGRLRQCTAAVAFVQLLVGWLLPTFFVARAEWQLARLRQQVEAQAAAASEQQQQPWAGASGSSRLQQNGGGASTGMDNAISGPQQWRGGSSTQQARRHKANSCARLSCWVMEHVFLVDCSGTVQVAAWCVRLTLCWLAAAALL